MRIVAGEFRGRRLHSPRGLRIRPTTDRVREAVFNIIAAEVPGATVLDLFAGTGALGLEAISRGADRAVFVDRDATALRLLHTNISLCGAEGRARVIHSSAEHALSKLEAERIVFELIFMDPPYGKGDLEKLLPQLHKVARNFATAVAEHHVKEILPPACGPWLRIKERVYGDTAVSFYLNSPVFENPEDMMSEQ